MRPGGASTGSPLALYVVRSTGVATSPVMAGQVQGSRTIAQFAQLNPSNLPARAALVALNGVLVNGSSGSTNPIYGHDLGSISPCVSPGGNAADTFALSVPRLGLYSAAQPSPLPTGYPTGIDSTYASWSPLYDSTHVDWVSIMSGNLIPDYTIPPSPYPPYSNNYQVGYVPGNATLPSWQIRGVLVVKGNLTVPATAHWDGIILVGGYLTAASGAQLHGMVVTGLNRALGQNPPMDTLPRGNSVVQWTWCYTQSSINSLSSLVPVRNGWANTWTTY